MTAFGTGSVSIRYLRLFCASITATRQSGVTCASENIKQSRARTSGANSAILLSPLTLAVSNSSGLIVAWNMYVYVTVGWHGTFSPRFILANVRGLHVE